MRVAFFDTHRFERESFTAAGSHFAHEITFLEPRLTAETAVLAEGFAAVCSFVNDRVDRLCAERLKRAGVKIVATRSAGINHLDLPALAESGIRLVRVPEYSPYAVAEFAMALLLTLNRKTHRAYLRVHELNFSLDGLVGSDLHGKTVGILGTGRIGSAFARIAHGFGCALLLNDPYPSAELGSLSGARYAEREEIYRDSDVISLHVPLLPETRHLIDGAALARMKPGVLLINTGRGALIDTTALIGALKQRRIGGAALDVYEEEENVFFQDLSETGLDDDRLARLLTFPQVIVTSHQAFLTREALANIARTTLQSLWDFEHGRPLAFEVPPPPADRSPG